MATGEWNVWRTGSSSKRGKFCIYIFLGVFFLFIYILCSFFGPPKNEKSPYCTPNSTWLSSTMFYIWSIFFVVFARPIERSRAQGPTRPHGLHTCAPTCNTSPLGPHPFLSFYLEYKLLIAYLIYITTQTNKLSCNFYMFSIYIKKHMLF